MGKWRKKEEYIAMAVEVIKNDPSIVFHQDVFAAMGVSRSTYWKKGLNKSEEIEQYLQANAIAKKKALRQRWFDGNDGKTQIALYRLLADPHEFERLNTASIRNHHSGQIDGGGASQITVEIVMPEDNDS